MHPWQGWEDTAIKSAYAEGIPTAQIAQQIKRTKDEVIGRARRLGIVHKNAIGGRNARTKSEPRK